MKKKILYIESGMGFGGASISLLEIVKYLDDYEPVIIFYTSSDEEFTKMFSGYKIIYLNAKFTYKHRESFLRKIESIIKNNKLIKLTNHFYTLLSWLYDKYQELLISSIIKKENISLLHLNNYPQNIPINAARRNKIPIVSHLRGYNVCLEYDRKTIDSIHSLIAPTKRIASHANLDLEIPESKISVIPNTISNNKSIEDDFKINTELRHKYNISDETILVGIFARIRPMKGQLELTNVILKLLEKGFDVSCLFVGDESDFDGNYIKDIKDLINRTDFKSKFIFAGYQNEVKQFYLATNIVMHPSIAEEAFGRVIIEAWSAKRPVIATDIAASVELIEDRVNGMLVPVNDLIEWEKSLVNLIEDPELLSAISQNGWLKTQNEYDSKKNIDNIKRIYKNLIDS